MNTKVCTKCEQSKPVDCFSKRSAAKDGLRDWCKECSNIYAKNYRLENPERVNAQIWNWRLANTEKINERSNKWRSANTEKAKQIQQKYRDCKKVKERAKVRGQKWRIDNPEKARNIVNNRRARKLSNGVFEVSAKELKKLYELPCAYCGSKESIQADHVIPINKGGRHSIGNLVPACQKCNASKSDKLLVEWNFYKRVTS